MGDVLHPPGMIIHCVQFNDRLFQRQHQHYGDKRQCGEEQPRAAHHKPGFCGTFVPLNHLLFKGAGIRNEGLFTHDCLTPP